MQFVNLMPYLRLMRADKPVGTLLLLWPTLIALGIAANGRVPFNTLLIFVLGVIVMRSAGCVINDFADRRYDGFVSRTKYRVLAQNLISTQSALYLFAILISIAFALALQLKMITLGLAVLALSLSIIYPFTKRFFSYPQLVLGLAFSCSVLMAFAEIQGNINIIALILQIAVILWVLAYDTEYAMTDRDDDKTIGLKSSALSFGNKAHLMIGLMKLSSWLCFVLLGVIAKLGYIYYGCLLLVALMFSYQLFLLTRNDPDRYMQAFKSHNYVGLLLTIGVYA